MTTEQQDPDWLSDLPEDLEEYYRQDMGGYPRWSLLSHHAIQIHLLARILVKLNESSSALEGRDEAELFCATWKQD